MERLKVKALSAFTLIWLFGFSNSTMGQSAGDFNISYGYNFKTDSRKAASSKHTHLGPSKFEVWFVPRFSARIEAASFISSKTEGQARVSGNGDVSFGFNAVVIPEDSNKRRPGLTLDYSFKVPAASNSLGSGEFDHQILGIVSRSLTERVYLEADCGGYFEGVTGGSSNKYGLISLIADVGLGPKKNGTFRWSVLEEIDGATASGGNPAEVTMTTLLNFKLTDRFRLTSGVKFGVTPYAPKVAFSISIRYSGSLRPLGALFSGALGAGGLP
jgi:hypothetical protein